MSKLTTALALTLGSATLATSASGAIFDSFITDANGDAPARNAATFTDTVDGVTLTGTVTTGRFFTSGSTGSGIDSRFSGGLDPNNFNRFVLNEYEAYTLSFDTAGTLTSIDIEDLSQAAPGVITATNDTTGQTATFALAISGAATDATFLTGIAVSAGETVSFGATGTVDYRIQEVNFTAIPEPASLALVGAGGLMLLRRRSAK